MRVLIADDSLVMRRLLEATLENWGYEVVSAQDGAEAWNVLQSEDAPNLAILDWIMPVFTGPEVCQMVRQLSRISYTYILLLTSKSQREDIVEGMGAGADDYVVKPFDRHELEVRLRAGRRIVELQAELLRAQNALREQATRDSLTGCWNRPTILEILDRELARSRREGRHLGVVMADLDGFKSINDTLGHFAGDHVLRETAHRMAAQMRPYDALGRYGGEEFLVVLPGCDEGCVMSHCDRLRHSVASQQLNWEGTEVGITCSFGASSAPPDLEITADTLIRIADDALYDAKNSGRNRVNFCAADNFSKT
jgi:two-component system, cell cycle response regulator